MRELFCEDKDYYNAVFSDEKLDIDESRLYSITSKADIEKSAGKFSAAFRKKTGSTPLDYRKYSEHNKTTPN